MSTRRILHLIPRKWARKPPLCLRNKCIRILSKSNMIPGPFQPRRTPLQTSSTVRVGCRHPTSPHNVTILQLPHTSHRLRMHHRLVSELFTLPVCSARLTTRIAASTAYQSAPASYEPYSPTPPTPYQPQSVIQQPAQQPYDPYKPTATVPTSNSYAPHQPARRLSGVPAQPQATQYDNRSPVPRSASSTYSTSFVVPSHPPPNGVPAQAPKPPFCCFRRRIQTKGIKRL